MQQQDPFRVVDHAGGRTRPPSQTSATAERSPQRVAGAVLQFNLSEELATLRQEEVWRQGEHNAKTLVKEPDLRVVLSLIKAQAKLPVHQAPVPITLQVLQGQLRVHLPDQTVDLPRGGLLVLEENLAHDVEALEESAFLLTLAWSAGDGAREPASTPKTDVASPTLDVR
jgi:quercetin dioxygenase-like cupin family protein